MPIYTNDNPIVFSNLVGLTSPGIAVSSAINNTTTQYDLIFISLKLGLGSTIGSTASIKIGYLESSDGGTTYDTQLRPQNTLATLEGYLSANQVLETTLVITEVPEYWKLCIINISGSAFSSVSGNFQSVFNGVKNTSSALLNSTQIAVSAISTTVLASTDPQIKNVKIFNTGLETIYVGSISVTISTGYPVVANSEIELANFANNSIYGITPSLTSLAAVLTW